MEDLITILMPSEKSGLWHMAKECVSCIILKSCELKPIKEQKRVVTLLEYFQYKQRQPESCIILQ
jgi:hypothetical protein